MSVINQRDHHAALISCTLWPHECLIAALPQRKDKLQRRKGANLEQQCYKVKECRSHDI